MARRKKGSSAIGFGTLVVLVIVGFTLQYWFIVLPLGIVASIYIVRLSRQHSLEQERQNRLLQIQELTQKAQRALKYVNEGKTIETRINNCEKALALFKQVDRFDEAKEVIEDLDQLKLQLDSTRRSLEAVDSLSKAHKQRFLGRKKSELKYLLEAIYVAEQNNVTDEDFRIIGAFDEEKGEPYRLSAIKKRAQELGWQNSKEKTVVLDKAVN